MSRRRLLVTCLSIPFVVLCALIGRTLIAVSEPVCGTYCVSVTPDADALTKNAGDWFLSSFTVTNSGSSADTYEYVTYCSGGAECEIVSTPPATLNPSQSGVFKLAVTMGGSNGVVKVKALGFSADSGWKNVTVVPVVTMTAPALTSDTTAVVYSKMPLLQATFYPSDANVDTTTLVVVVGSDTVTSLTRYNRGLVEWQLDSARQLTSGVLKKVSVRICLTNGQCQTAKRYYKLDDSGKPWVSFDGMPLEAHGRVFSAPFGPGLSVSGAEIETGFSVPGYVSMGAARSVGLVYSTRQSHPRALVQTDVELSWPAGTPDQIKAVLIDGITHVDSVTISSPSCSAAVGRRCRIALQRDFAGSTFSVATRKWLKVQVSVTSSGTTKTTTDSVEVTLVDRRSSSYGSGWAMGGVLRLDAAGTDMLLVGPTGTVTVFRGNGGVYLSPPGDYSRLVWTGSVWELRFRTGGKLVFDSQGRQTKIVDLDANETVIAYSGSTERVTSITDPAGKQFTFTYDGSNHIATIVNNSVQTSKVTVNGSNQLTYDSTSSPAASAYTETFKYTSSGSNSAILLRYRANAVGDSTTVGYSSTYQRPTQDSLPAVLTETGSSLTRPIIQYAPQETRALGTLISADSVYVSITDPRGNWTRSALNRWGAAIRSWDALGTLSRASFTPEGFVAWSEGKVADSTRVYHTYDGFGRLARSYRWRAAADMVRLDSLVYDANHWIIRRVDPLGNVAKLDYDGEGHVIRSITPTNDTTRYWYSTEGLLDSSRAPGQTKSTSVRRNAGWKNDTTAIDSDGRTLRTSILDNLGRVVESQRRVTTRRSGATTYYEWRRTLTTLNAAGQVTSTRVERTGECTPCTTPSGWPNLSTDTLRYDSVYVVYSRLGRDSLRVNVRGKALKVVLDALGRVRARYPWFTDHPSQVDSFRYDIGGNLRYQWTRRGTQIDHLYDSRNRDTLTTVPGVGSYRRAFAGPNDELTRLWIDSYVDSIGGVNPEVRFGYGQAGQLLADTAQGTRVATHVYDRYGRDSVITDLNGIWKLRYHAVRGAVERIVTPFSDSIAYGFDSWGRRTGPTVMPVSDANFVGSQGWSSAGQLTGYGFAHVGSYTVGAMTNIDTTDAVSAIRMAWTEQHGSGGTTVNWEDSISVDGFDRLTVNAVLKNSSTVVRDSFTFDRDGNIRRTGSHPIYETSNSQLASLGGLDYSYDAAGNQTANPTLTFGYDALDRLVSVRSSGTLIARYAYDVMGRRIVKRVYNPGPSGADTLYLRMIYSGGQVAAEADSSGTVAVRYTWGLGADDLVGMRDSSSGTAIQYYITRDQLGSIRGISKRDGTWIATLRYRSYGAMLDSSGTIPARLRYRWIGREFDAETGLYYVRARYYDPESQRFTQEDPIGFAGGSNVYAYGNGNPTNGRDLDGLAKQYMEDPFNFLAACIGTIGGCYEDDYWGGGGSMGDFLDLQMLRHDLMSLTEEQYKRAFEARKADGTFSGNGFESTVALTGDQFTQTKEALITLLEAKPFSRDEHAQASRGLIGMFRTGRIGFQPGVGAFGQTDGRLRIALTETFFSPVKERMAFTLAHEYGHIALRTGRRSLASERLADMYAVRVTGLRDYCNVDNWGLQGCHNYRP